jgi:hypothetical protein
MYTKFDKMATVEKETVESKLKYLEDIVERKQIELNLLEKELKKFKLDNKEDL